MSQKVLGALAPTALVVALVASGCGQQETKVASGSQAAERTTATATSAPVKNEPRVRCDDLPELNLASDLRSWTTDEANDAYCDLVEVTVANSLTSLLQVPVGDLTPDHLAFMQDYLTPAADATWNVDVDTALEHIEKTGEFDSYPVGMLTTVRGTELVSQGYEFPATAPFSSGIEISEGRVDEMTLKDGTPALILWFTYKTNLEMAKSGIDYTMPMIKEIGYTLVRTDGGVRDWLIDGWNGSIHWGKIARRS